MPLPDFVRVRAENGQHISISRAKAEAAGYKPLKQEALGRDGRALPPKTRVSISEKAAAAKPTTTREADASEESQED